MFEGHNNHEIAKVSHLDPNVATVKARLESLQNACDALRDSMALRRFLRTVGDDMEEPDRDSNGR